jgi:hypothetical protein
LILGVLASRGLEVHHDQPPVGIALDEVEGADQVPVEDGTGRLVDERHGERRLDGHDLGRVGHAGAQDREHPGAEVEQRLGGVFLREPNGLVRRLSAQRLAKYAWTSPTVGRAPLAIPRNSRAAAPWIPEPRTRAAGMKSGSTRSTYWSR